MSFFGFDTAGHDQSATGFSQSHNPFAGLSQGGGDGDALEFEDTYDGLGDQLDETDDVFNDETFGGNGGGAGAGAGPGTGAGGRGGAASSGAFGKDFDFFGQTAKVSNAIEEEHMLFNRQQPAAKAAPAPTAQPAPPYGYASHYAAAPARTGYEKYKEGPVGELQVDAALWGVAPKKQPPPTQVPGLSHAAPMAALSRKMMSLEEVEAQMRAQTRATPQPAAQAHVLAPPPQSQFQHQPQQAFDNGYSFAQARAAQQAPPVNEASRPKEGAQHAGHAHPVQILQRPQSKQSHGIPVAPSPQQRQQLPQLAQPTQILQNPNRLSGDAARIGIPPQQHGHQLHQMHSGDQTHRSRGSISHQTQIITHPSQLAHLSEEEKASYLEQEAKRAKRNHKIFLMSKDNGVMTPQDKNFITRIQLQQLVSATGNPNEHGTDETLAEDFYYQVHNQIQGGQRQHPSQPLNNFAQTYLFQTGGRQGGFRRHNRGGDNHMQRMEQQVQRAVEAAKNKPKNKQLVIEGSLGKISFSNSKTPKPLLSIKRTESTGNVNRPGSAHGPPPPGAGLPAKAVLRSIEAVYDTLMMMEDNDRLQPPPPTSEGETAAVEKYVTWRDEAQRLNTKLWDALKIHEPLGVYPIHPFIALLSYGKGKKAMQRVFRHTSHEQRTTILTLIVVNLDKLDVVSGAQVNTGDTRHNAAMRENIDLFSLAVMSTLFNFMNELDLDIVTGVLGLVCTQNVDIIARSRIGASMLTMILSRAELIKHNGAGNEQAWQIWDATYTQFFNLLEPSLPYVFPGTVNSGEDVYVWQLLAAIGIGASPEQQQRLVLAVKDRVMETVALAKTLPQEMAAVRLQNVNLFMRSIGLDVELLQ